jgi:D-3-phosphoglycerate dehydrogenase
MLAVLRRIPQSDRMVRGGVWAREAVGQLNGKVLGIVGTGAIGARTAHLGRAFGMRVLAFTANPSPERARALGVEFTSLDDLLRASDVVSLHVPLTAATRRLISARELALMKPSAILVNTARGAVVGEAALADVLRERRILGAGLDVFSVEPLPASHPFTSLDNVVLSPHNAPMTEETQREGVRRVLENVAGFLRGGEVTRVV